MYDQDRLRSRLPVGWIGEQFFYYQKIGSTNEKAIQLARSGAPHGTLVLADQQTEGKGRGGRSWITVPGAALAVSVILRPAHLGGDGWMRLYGLGALGVAEALDEFGLKTEIKWPNDVLLADKKVAGILLNNIWLGERVDYSVLGIGVNISPEAVPREAGFDFPAISVETCLGYSIEREQLLLSILTHLMERYGDIGGEEFIDNWGSRLAYLEQDVEIRTGDGDIHGTLAGLSSIGELKIITPSGEEVVVDYGDVRLRPKE